MVDANTISYSFLCKKMWGTVIFYLFQSTESQKREEYINKIIDEIRLYPKVKYDTNIFRWGTPSLLEPYQVKKILKELDLMENNRDNSGSKIQKQLIKKS